ncbi:MAG TPA: NADH-quinone oxidoreductase subunit J [Actinomycetota bacterium]|nr:NADH-quinone oxidoreductase subunit J [Actinomycetota bacterium]
MNIEMVVFGVMFVVALGSSIAMLFAPNAVHTALFLVAAQIALALAFLLQGAFFVAVIQIIVYAGAIMVLFLFVIMLLGVDREEALIDPLPGQRSMAVGLGALLAVEIAYVSWKGATLVSGIEDGGAALTALNRDPGNVESIAHALFSRYLLPFEATSVLLVVAIVGVMVLARRLGDAPGDIASPEPVESAEPA